MAKRIGWFVVAVAACFGIAGAVEAAAPVLALTKAHTGTFTQGSAGTWTLTIQNNSAMAADVTDGSAVTVSDTLPAGYTLFSVSGANWNCSGSVQTAAACTSTSVVAGAGGQFPVLTLGVNIPGNSPTGVTNTGRVFGGGDLTHTNIGNAALSSDTVGVIQAPSSINLMAAGNNQSVAVGTAFPVALSATVRDAGSAPINGLTVTFTAPSSGASGTFSGGTNAKTALTNASGVAVSTTYTANGTAGGPYIVSVAAGTVGKISPRRTSLVLLRR